MGAIVRNVSLQNGRWKFRKVIPAKLRPHIDGQPREFIKSLGPGGKLPPPEVLAKYAKVRAECDAMLALAKKREAGAFDELSAETVAYIVAAERSHMLHEDDEDRFSGEGDAVFEAVAGELAEAGGAWPNRHPDREWKKRQESAEAALELWRHEYGRGQISRFLTDELQDICAGRGLNVDVGGLGFRRLGRAYLAMLIEVTESKLRRQQGDVVITPEPPSEKAPVPVDKKQTITGLVNLWWVEAKAANRAQSTYEAYERAGRFLANFLEHDDANAVTAEDIIRFKEKRIADGVNLKTIGDGDLAGLKVIFGWAKRSRKIATNPADGISVIVPKRVTTRSKGFTNEEVKNILRHAGSHRQGATEGHKMAMAKKWCPWLCAYTGARIGEVAQLRKADVLREYGQWVLVLTPEAGTIKQSRYRKVPIHPHLIELGFVKFAQSASTGPLFLAPKRPGEDGVRAAWRTTKNKVTEFVRKVAKDERVQPNHGWRHLFETTARNLGAREDVTNWITGHATKGVAAQYGETEINAMALVIDRLPRHDATMSVD